LENIFSPRRFLDCPKSFRSPAAYVKMSFNTLTAWGPGSVAQPGGKEIDGAAVQERPAVGQLQTPP
jgi:hypothetical protein